jgi:hypothetical protein
VDKYGRVGALLDFNRHPDRFFSWSLSDDYDGKSERQVAALEPGGLGAE